MSGTIQSIRAFAGEFVARAREVQLSFLAAAVTYYALVSLVPLLALVLVLSAALGGDELVESQLDQFRAVLTPRTRTLVEEALVGGTARVGASAIGTVVLLWSGLRVLRALDTAFSTIYGRESPPSLLRSILDGIVVLTGIAVGVALVGTLLLGVRMLPLGPLARTVAVLAGIATLTAVLLPVFVIFPSRPVSVREAAPGALTAALGWTVLGSTFSLYVAVAGNVTLYGPLGGVLLLVTLLYAGAVVVMIGAVLNVTLAADRQLQHDGSRQSPVSGAMASDASGDDDGAGAGGERPDWAEDAPEERAADAAEQSVGADPDADGGGTRAVGADATEFDPDDRSDADRQLRAELEDLRDELETFRADVEDRTVHRESLEGDLKRYVRRRVRRGHARGWGPYLVLLYGTAMTIAAFSLLSSGWAILAMVVIWLSTLGLYALMVLVGFGLSILGLPGRLRDAVGEWRS